ADEQPLTELRDPGYDAEGEDSPAHQPDRRRGDEQRIEPERPARVPRQRRAVQSQLPERNRSHRDESQVEPESLRQRRPHLAPLGGSSAGRAGRYEQGW